MEEYNRVQGSRQTINNVFLDKGSSGREVTEMQIEERFENNQEMELTKLEWTFFLKEVCFSKEDGP